MYLHNGNMRQTAIYNNRLQMTRMNAINWDPPTNLLNLTFEYNQGVANNGSPSVSTTIFFVTWRLIF